MKLFTVHYKNSEVASLIVRYSKSNRYLEAAADEKALIVCSKFYGICSSAARKKVDGHAFPSLSFT